jgi:hypothetical protein
MRMQQAQGLLAHRGLKKRIIQLDVRKEDLVHSNNNYVIFKMDKLPFITLNSGPN